MPVSSVRKTSSRGSASSGSRASSRGSGSRASGRRSTKSKESEKGLSSLTLRQAVKQRFLKDVLTKSTDKVPGWKVLVVDTVAMRTVSCAIGMYDLMEHQVSMVEDLDKKRAPQKDSGVIYLLEQSDESVERLLQEFDNNFLYGKSVFVYFLGPLPDHLLDKIKQCRPLLSRLKALGEINVDFLVKEERAYHLDMQSTFRPVYVRGSKKAELDIAAKLVTVCVTLNEYPHIRYREGSESGAVLAKAFHKQMDAYLRSNEAWWYHGDGNHTDRARGTLLLLDRKDDCLTPIMHEFTYQPMIYDLLETEDEKVSYPAETFDSDQGPMKMVEKEVLLNENDALWVEIRSKHIAEVSQILSTRIKEIVNSDTSGLSQKDKTKNMTLTQMANALKQFPEYREVMSKLSQHMHLSQKCMEIFKSKNLYELSQLEQTLATGKTEEGRSPKLDEMVEEVYDMLVSLKDPLAKARLLMVFIVTQRGIKPEHKNKLWGAAKLPGKLEQMIFNLEKMDIQMENHEQGTKLNRLFGSKIQSSGGVDEDSEYANSRYAPPIKDILSQLVYSRLSIDEYPSLMPMPQQVGGSSAATATSARRRSEATSIRGSTTSRWQRSSAEKKTKGSFAGERYMVFVVGGVSYSELRVAREVMSKEGKEIVIGSTHFCNPEQFMKDLAQLS